MADPPSAPSYRYEPRPDRNIELREELLMLALQKLRYTIIRLDTEQRSAVSINCNSSHRRLLT